jgi:hypothetical protein
MITRAPLSFMPTPSLIDSEFQQQLLLIDLAGLVFCERKNFLCP